MPSRFPLKLKAKTPTGPNSQKSSVLINIKLDLKLFVLTFQTHLRFFPFPSPHHSHILLSLKCHPLIITLTLTTREENHASIHFRVQIRGRPTTGAPGSSVFPAHTHMSESSPLRARTKGREARPRMGTRSLPVQNRRSRFPSASSIPDPRRGGRRGDAPRWRGAMNATQQVRQRFAELRWRKKHPKKGPISPNQSP